MDAFKLMKQGMLTPDTPGSYRAVRNEADRMLKQGTGPTLAAVEMVLQRTEWKTPELREAAEAVTRAARTLGW